MTSLGVSTEPGPPPVPVRRSRRWLVIPIAFAVYVAADKLWLGKTTPVAQSVRFDTVEGADEVHVVLARSSESQVPEREARVAVIGTTARYDFRAPSGSYELQASVAFRPGSGGAQTAVHKTLVLDGNPVRIPLRSAPGNEVP